MKKEELLVLAEEIVDCEVFGDWMLPKGDLNAVTSTFMVLIFMDKERIKKMQDDNVVAMYEHLSESGNLCVNGHPTFFSCHMLTGEDVKLLNPMVEKLKKAREKAKKEIMETG